jgi:hemin uptake protein HemP
MNPALSEDEALAVLPVAVVPRASPVPRRRLASEALFDGEVEIEIEHRSQVYRLRQTSLGKLILTK